MGKVSYKITKLFKSKEQLEIEARMEFEKNRRSFVKYNNELDTTIKTFSKMAKDAELNGNHAAAVASAKFVLKLQNTQVRIQNLIQRFEMVRAMQRLSGVYTSFVDACGKMGVSIDSDINLKELWRSNAQMDMAISKLDAMTDGLDSVFDSIDTGLGNGMSDDNEEDMDSEAYKLLDQIMGRDNAQKWGPQQSAAPQAAQKQVSSSTDSEEEKLRRMMEELK